MTEYPSDWFGGKYIGSIKESGLSYQVNIRNDKKYYKSFSFDKDSKKSKKKALEQAIEYRNKISDEINATINKIRYIDENTIEVKLTQNQVLITDSKFVDVVEQYKLQAKKVRQYYYAVYQVKKQVKRFVELICDLSDVEYINGNRLDNRFSNLKGKGELSKELIKEDKQDYDHLSFKYHYYELPKNIWLLGKPSGTIFKRTGENIWTVCVVDENNKQHIKTFNPEKYNEFDIDADTYAYIDAEEWLYKTSNDLGLTKNRIKLIDDDYIEVEISKGLTTVTDKQFLKLIESIPLFATKSGNKNAKYYAACIYDGKQMCLHNLITGYKMVDHINRDPLNNRLSNLKDTTIKLNNNNRSIGSANTSGHIGVRYIPKGGYWQAYIKQDDITHSKSFSVSEYGHDEAKKLAIQARKEFNKKYGSKNGENV